MVAQLPLVVNRGLLWSRPRAPVGPGPPNPRGRGRPRRGHRGGAGPPNQRRKGLSRRVVQGPRWRPPGRTTGQEHSPHPGGTHRTSRAGPKRGRATTTPVLFKGQGGRGRAQRSAPPPARRPPTHARRAVNNNPRFVERPMRGGRGGRSAVPIPRRINFDGDHFICAIFRRLQWIPIRAALPDQFHNAIVQDHTVLPPFPVQIFPGMLHSTRRTLTVFGPWLDPGTRPPNTGGGGPRSERGGRGLFVRRTLLSAGRGGRGIASP